MSKKEAFKKLVDDATKHINDLGSKASKNVNKAIKKMAYKGSVRSSYEKATYEYEIVGTAKLNGRPLTVRGFLVDDALELLVRFDQKNQSYVKKNIALRDKNDQSLIQIDQVYRDEVIYVDLSVNQKVEKIACFLATYKAFDESTFVKDVINVEEDRVVGQAHISKD